MDWYRVRRAVSAAFGEYLVNTSGCRLCHGADLNVVRHAQAKHCDLIVQMENESGGNGRLLLQIDDDGIGLSQTLRAGVGLTSMRERAEELGGQFQIKSSAKTGTRVTAVLPILTKK